MKHSDEIARRFALEGVRFDETGEGLVRARITEESFAAEVFLQGAHLTRYSREGRPVLFMSEESFYKQGKALRGGVPVIFPWFGNHPADSSLPAHGFARTAEWSLDELRSENREFVLAFSLRTTERSREIWPHEFLLEYEMRIGESLELSLRTSNRGEAPFRFEQALHTYLAVGAIEQIAIEGLEGAEYIDKTDAMQRKRLERKELSITGETDSVFVNTTTTCVVHDPSMKRRIEVTKKGSESTVIWNPWSEKAKSFADFGDEEWRTMVCIEAANAGENAVTLDPGESRVMSVLVSEVRE